MSQAVTMQNATMAAAMLVVDAATADAISLLRGDAIPTILLRGPAIAERLYGREELRPYGDADVLVPREAFDRAEGVLQKQGFREVPAEVAAGSERPGHAHTWIGPKSGVAIDLHATLIGIGTSPERLWHTLADEVETLELAGTTVQIPSPRAIALILALHAWQHAALPDVPLEDLRRAVRLFPKTVWADAASLSQDVDAVAAFTTGLGMVSGGVKLVETLGLEPGALHKGLRGSQAFHIAQGLDWLRQERGTRAKAVFVVRKWLPQPHQMRALYPLARRGIGGLAASYVWRTGILAWHTPGALLLRRRARRARASQY